MALLCTGASDASRSSTYDAGTSPLPPTASATFTHPEPSSSSSTCTLLSANARAHMVSGQRPTASAGGGGEGLSGQAMRMCSPETESSNGDVGSKSNRTRATGPGALSSALCVDGAKDEGVGVACPDRASHHG